MEQSRVTASRHYPTRMHERFFKVAVYFFYTPRKTAVNTCSKSAALHLKALFGKVC